jgi:MOSC domain-containing protein YiiM
LQEGYIEKLQIQGVRKGPFEAVSSVILKEGQGIVGDCHYGGGNKQIAFLSAHIMQQIKSQEIPGLCFSKFQGNIITDGIDYSKLTLGDILITENTQLEISANTKQCFTECNRLQQELPCEMIHGIAYARVLRSGILQTGEKVWIK